MTSDDPATLERVLALVMRHNRGHDHPEMLENEVAELLFQACVARTRRAEYKVDMFCGALIGIVLLFVIFRLAGGH